MMDLRDIGFYTLSNGRAKNVTVQSQLMRCELLITSACNFKCPYCRGTESDADITFEQAKHIVDLWCRDGLQNIRFSGGEPTAVLWLPEIIKHARRGGVHRIAISTNGSAHLDTYKHLISCGCNDFSISLDACCSYFGDKMAGVDGQWNNVITNIERLSQLVYVTVGCVFDEKNVQQSLDTVQLAHALGVADIRIISSSQYNETLEFVEKIPKNIIDAHPILKYRVNNFKDGRNVRGINSTDNKSCPLVLDDMCVRGDNHYPCIIHMREGGAPIGRVSDKMRDERFLWFSRHDCHEDKICSKNCLDVCVDYNNKVKEYADK